MSDTYEYMNKIAQEADEPIVDRVSSFDDARLNSLLNISRDMLMGTNDENVREYYAEIHKRVSFQINFNKVNGKKAKIETDEMKMLNTRLDIDDAKSFVINDVANRFAVEGYSNIMDGKYIAIVNNSLDKLILSSTTILDCKSISEKLFEMIKGNLNSRESAA